MNKIWQLLFLFLTVGLSFVSCQDIGEDAPNEIPNLSKPTIGWITNSSARVYGFSHDGDGHSVYISTNKNMDNAKQYSYSSRDSYVTINGLESNTTYYVRYVVVQRCYENDSRYEVKSPVTSFKTATFASTSYSIRMNSLPVSGYYGVLTMDNVNGYLGYDRISGNYTMKPNTRVSDYSTVYVMAPYISNVMNPKSVPLYGGNTDYYFASGAVDPENPYVSLDLKRYTATVNVNVRFKQSTDEQASSVTLQKVAITNVEGRSPICLDGSLDITSSKHEFTPNSSGRIEYSNTSSASLKDGAVVSRTFRGVIPVSFAKNKVKVCISLSGDITNEEVSLPLDAFTWKEGDDVTIDLTAEYTAKKINLSISNISINPWSSGSTGNMEIIK